MADEHITTTSTPDGRTTHTTVSGGASSSSGMGWLIGLVLVALLGIGIYYFAQQSSSEANMNNAVAGAAQDVGDAAQTAGTAAKDAADSLKK